MVAADALKFYGICVIASKSLEQSAGLRRGFGGSRNAKNVAGVQICG
jgi:hypothetical protein